jgi:hypothetical protein
MRRSMVMFLAAVIAGPVYASLLRPVPTLSASTVVQLPKPYGKSTFVTSYSMPSTDRRTLQRITEMFFKTEAGTFYLPKDAFADLTFPENPRLLCFPDDDEDLEIIFDASGNEGEGRMTVHISLKNMKIQTRDTEPEEGWEKLRSYRKF